MFGIGHGMAFRNKHGLSLNRNGLVLQLDATNAASLTKVGTRIDQWNDLSGNGNNFATGGAGTAYNPIWSATSFNGGPGAYFDGNQGAYLESVSALSSVNINNYTVVAVLKSSFRTFGSFVQDKQIAGLLTSNRGNRIGPTQTTQGFPFNVPTIIGVASNGSTVPSYIVNGKVVAGFSPFGNGYSNNLLLTNVQFGDAIPSGGIAGGYWRALYIWNRKLTDTELTNTYKYLSGLHGVTPVAPTRNFVFDGDSITYGYYGDTQPYHSKAISNLGLNETDYFNFGIGGQNITDMVSNAAARIDPLKALNATSKYNVVICFGGTNDINGGQSAATVYANIKAYCQARKAAGWPKVVVITILPRGSFDSGKETVRQSVNASINANAVSEGWADTVADVGGDATIGVSSATSNSTYYADGTHPAQAGHTIIAGYVQTALNAVTA